MSSDYKSAEARSLQSCKDSQVLKPDISHPPEKAFTFSCLGPPGMFFSFSPATWYFSPKLMTWNTTPPHSSLPASKAGCPHSQSSDHGSFPTQRWQAQPPYESSTSSAYGSQTACQALSAKRLTIYNQSGAVTAPLMPPSGPWAHSSPAWESHRGCFYLWAAQTHGGGGKYSIKPPASLDPLGRLAPSHPLLPEFPNSTAGSTPRSLKKECTFRGEAVRACGNTGSVVWFSFDLMVFFRSGVVGMEKMPSVGGWWVMQARVSQSLKCANEAGLWE